VYYYTSYGKWIHSSKVYINRSRIATLSVKNYVNIYDIILCDCAKSVDYFAANAYIMVEPKNTTAMEGTRVRLVCQAEAHPNNITYQWYRDGVDVHLVTGLMARAGIYGDGSFIISSVQRSDTGWYRCQPTNGLGPPPSADAFLNVTCKRAYMCTLGVSVCLSV